MASRIELNTDYFPFLKNKSRTYSNLAARAHVHCARSEVKRERHVV